MAIEQHVVKLTATDNVSPAYKNIAKEAKNAGDKAEQAAKDASRSTQDWSKAASNMGRVLGGLAAVAIKLGNDSEVSQRRLEQSIANTGDSYALLEDQIKATTDAALQLGFDDEDAVDAITTLTDATGDAEKAIKDLSIAEDIARGRGISLAAATNIVVAAEQGRYGALKRMGIAIDETATSEEALAALHSKYAGQAEAYATTNAAAWDRMGNTIENALEMVGGHLADVQGPLIALGGASQLIGPLGDAVENLGVKAKAASLASSLLSSAWLGPIGLAVGAAAAGFAIYELATRESNAEKQAKALTAATDDYTRSIQEMTTALVTAGTYDISQQTAEYLQVITDNAQIAQTRINALTDATDLLIVSSTQFAGTADDNPWTRAVEAGLIDEYTAQVLAASDANHDYRLTADEISSAQKVLASGFEASDEQLARLTKTVGDVTAATSDPNLFGADIAQEQLRILTELGNGYIGVEDAITQLNALPLDPKFNKALQESKKSSYEATDAYKAQSTEWKASVPILGDVAQGIAGVTRGMTRMGGASTDAGRDVSRFDAQLEELGDTLTDTGSEGLERYMQMIVGFTDGIVDAISGAKDWADALIAPKGVYSEIDTLLADGKITLDQYNEAQQAQVDITEAYNEAATARNQIQAMQAPLIADQAAASAEYLTTIAGMTEQEQLLALAWADSDLAGRANDIAAMASEFDDMGAAQQDAFASMVTSAAATDPALAAVLENLGLIKASTTDPTGWEINMDTMGAESDLDRVADAVNNLVNILAQIYHLDVTANLDTTNFWNTYNSIPTSKTITVYTASGSYGFQPAFALGGTAKDMDTAALGRVGRGMTLVGEHGPEMVSLPHGSVVTPNHATRYKRGDSGPAVMINIEKVVAPDFETFMSQMKKYQRSMNRT